jgi:exportin-T
MSFPTQHQNHSQACSEFDSLFQKSLESNHPIYQTPSSKFPQTTKNEKEKAKQDSVQAFSLLKSQPERYFFILLERFSDLSAESDDRLFLCLSLFEIYYCGESSGWVDHLRGQPNNPVHLIREKLLMGIIALLQKRPLASFITSKIAQIFAKIFIREYISWPAFFPDLSQVLMPRGCLDASSQWTGEELFLKTCLAVNESIAVQAYQKDDADAKLHAEIKDVMRGRDVSFLVSIWENELKGNNTTSAFTKKIQNLALRCFGAYTPWIDVALTAKPDILAIVYNFLGDREMRCNACVCLTEIVAKGMPVLEKLKLLKYLNVMSIFDAILADPLNRNGGNGDDSFLSKSCILLCTCGETIASGIKLENSKASFLIEYLFELAMRMGKFLEGLDTVEHKILLIPFCNDFTDFIKREKAILSPIQRDFCKSFLFIILKNLEYPDCYFDDFTSPEDEEVFPDFREGLFLSYDSLMNGLAGEATPLLYEYIEGAALCEPVKNGKDLKKKELALTLLYRHPETIKTQPVFSYSIGGVAKTTKIAELLCSAFDSIHQNISLHNPQFRNLMTKSYLELGFRYGTLGFFKTYSKYFSIVLDLFFQAVKGGHSDSRQFASNHLTKFLKSNKELISGNALQALLVVVKEFDFVNFADSFVDLNEAVGFISGVTGNSEIFHQVITLHMQRLSCDATMVRKTIPSLKAIGTLAKGLYDSENRTLISDDNWLSLLEHSIKPLIQSNYLSLEILSASNFTVQRLLVVAKRHVLLVLGDLVQRCLESGSVDLVGEVMPILSATTFRLKEQSGNFVASAIIPLSGFLTTRPSVEGDDEKNALIELKKQYLAFLNASIASGLISIFDTDDQKLSVILGAVQKCLESPNEPLVVRSALTFITKLLPNISPITRANFNAFCLQVLLPASFRTLISSQVYSVEDSLGLSLLNELALFHITISVIIPSPYSDAMRSILVKDLGFGESGASQVIDNIVQCDQKTVKELFLAIFKDLKKHFSPC